MQKLGLNSISVVSPIYRAENCLDELHRRISKALEKITQDYEIILVNDSSPDASWSKIQEICKNDSKVIGVNLSRNFGQHYAITAGLEKSSKDWIVVMDCDLQDQPEEIEKFVKLANEGFQVIQGQRLARKDTFFKKLFSKLFYKTLGYLTGTEQDPSIANFGLYHRKVIQAILSTRDSIRYFPTMVQWAGFKKIKVEIDHASRLEGESSYNFKRLMLLAMDIILANSDKPLRLVVKLGLSISILSFLFAGYVVYHALLGHYQVLGYASLMASLWLIAGIVIFILGIIGLYLGKTFQQSKDRPIYIISEVLNSGENK